MREQREQSFFRGAAVLTAATFIVKFINIFFSVPLANFLGGEGMGHFYTAYDIFLFFNVLATSGTPVAISRLVSVAYAQGKKREADKIFRTSFVLLTSIGLFGTVVMFVFARQFSQIFMHSDRTMYAIMALAPMTFFMSLSSCLRGYFQGRSNMTPTAVSQVLESTVKLFVGLGLAVWFMNTTACPELGAAGAIVGVSVGAVFAFVFIGWEYLRTIRAEAYDPAEPPVSSTRSILKSILTFAVPVIVGTSFLSFLDLVDAAVMMARLQGAAGIGETEAAILKGLLGNARKYFDLPNALIIPVSTTVLPQLAAVLARKDEAGIRRISRLGLHLTLIFAIPSAAGLCVFAGPICRILLYNQPTDAMNTAPLLAAMSPGIIFAGLLYTSNAMLHAKGRVYEPIINMCIGTVVRIAIVYVFCGIPAVNAMGSAVSTPVSYLVMILLNMRTLHRLIPETPSVLKLALRPLLATVIMVAVSLPVQLLLSHLLGGSRMAIVISILVAIAVYAVASVKTGAVTREEVLHLPKGTLIARVLRVK